MNSFMKCFLNNMIKMEIRIKLLIKILDKCLISDYNMKQIHYKVIPGNQERISLLEKTHLVETDMAIILMMISVELNPVNGRMKLMIV